MYKIAICDDEKIMCEYLQKKVSEILTQWEILFTITCYTDALDLLNTSLSYDLILLDIQMPHLDGITLAQKIKAQSEKCELIFITILKEYVLYAFEVEALDYIYKPIEHKRLENALKRAIKHYQKKKKNLLIQNKNCYQTIPLEEIYYCEVINRKLYLHLQHDVIEYYGKLQEIQKQLDKRFLKCHRSYIVNMDYIKKYESPILTMKNEEKVPVSRLQQKEFIEKMLYYLKGRET